MTTIHKHTEKYSSNKIFSLTLIPINLPTLLTATAASRIAPTCSSFNCVSPVWLIFNYSSLVTVLANNPGYTILTWQLYHRSTLKLKVCDKYNTLQFQCQCGPKTYNTKDTSQLLQCQSCATILSSEYPDQ